MSEKYVPVVFNQPKKVMLENLTRGCIVEVTDNKNIVHTFYGYAEPQIVERMDIRRKARA